MERSRCGNNEITASDIVNMFYVNCEYKEFSFFFDTIIIRVVNSGYVQSSITIDLFVDCLNSNNFDN